MMRERVAETLSERTWGARMYHVTLLDMMSVAVADALHAPALIVRDLVDDFIFGPDAMFDADPDFIEDDDDLDEEEIV